MAKKDISNETQQPETIRDESFAAIAARRMSRRGFLRYAAAGSAVVALGACGQQPPVAAPQGAAATATDAPTAVATVAPTTADNTTAPAEQTTTHFQAIEPDSGDMPVVPAGYVVMPLIRWGDPLTADAPAFDVAHQTAATQQVQFGYNNDFVGFFPLPVGNNTSDHGLLAVNHEYPNPDIMFPGFDFEHPTQEQIDIELACQGISVVEVQRDANNKWSYVQDSAYNHRITSITPMEITGPAAGHDLLKTNEDPTGKAVLGTLNNCSGGKTPWGTYVSGEENFHQYFANLEQVTDETVKALHERYGVPEGTSELKFELFYDRYDMAKEPHEPFRFGWLVEIDPYDATFVPKKRTALGRFRHEAATFVVVDSGKVVAYSGDDERFEYLYKFVTEQAFDANKREANFNILDSGTLYVAVFNDDGTGKWMPLVAGEGTLTADKGFATQADVLIGTRLAASEVGATPMDRPEDVEVNPVNKKVYVMLTNNTKRKADNTNAANPRPENAYGHVIEITEQGDDHTATTFTWEILLLCGPKDDDTTYFGGYDKTMVSSISCPDNCTFDHMGNLWIATDGQPSTIDTNDGLFLCPVDGAERGKVQQFFSAVKGAEVCGPEFTPDNTTLFAAIQHPGEGGTFDEPLSVWPDGTTPTRPSVVVIQAENGNPIVS